MICFGYNKAETENGSASTASEKYIATTAVSFIS
jgi:hypothetical protein